MKAGIDYQLDRAEAAIEGALVHPEIMNRMAEFGYNHERILAGKALLDDAKDQQSAKNEKKGNQLEASATLKQDHQQAWKTYMLHVKLARLGIDKASGAWKKLQLAGARKHTFAGWIEQARSFYQELSQDEALLQKTKITQEELAQAQAMIGAVRTDRQYHKYCKSEAEQATQTSRQALQELEIWTKNFLKIASVALADQKQMMEALGIVVKA